MPLIVPCGHCNELLPEDYTSTRPPITQPSVEGKWWLCSECSLQWGTRIRDLIAQEFRSFINYDEIGK